MTMNPDPRPGRWLLPLVVLGMVVFTYVFVRSLPGAEAGPDAGPQTTTTTGQTTSPPEGSTTTTAVTPPLAPETQAYLDGLDALAARLVELQTELAQINSDWENRQSTGVTYGQTEQALVDLVGRIDAWTTDVEGLVPPDSLVVAHDTVVQFSHTVSETAQAVLDGLRAPDTGEARREAVARFDEAVGGFTAAVEQAKQTAQTS